MRFLYLVGFVIGLALADSELDVEIKPRFCETEVGEMLTCVKEVLKTGLPEVGLPSLNPFEMFDTTIDLDAAGIHSLAGKITIEHLVLSGITNFEVDKLKIVTDMIGGFGVQLSGDFKIPKLQLDSELNLDGMLSGKELRGEGGFSIGIEELKISLLVRIRIGDFSLKELKIVPTYKDIPYSSTGLKIGDLDLEEYIALHAQDFKDIFEYIISLIQQKRFQDKYVTQRADFLQIIVAILAKCPPKLDTCMPF